MRKIETRRKRPVGIHIRDIEKKLFSYLYSNKVATSKQIARDVMPDISHQARYKRLNQLIAFGYLQACYHRDTGRILIYSLGDKGFRDFLTAAEASHARKQLKSASVTHDLSLVDIRSRLKKLSSVARYYSENLLSSGFELEDDDELRAFKPFRFDAILKLNMANKGHFVALEFERSCKFAARYASYFRRIYACPEMKVILFIGANREILDRVMTNERKIIANGWPKVFYALLSEVLTSTGSVSFSNLNQEKIVLI